jgi:inosine/xanthosine triphosphatase
VSLVAGPLASLRRVRVGSTNGPKIAAVRAALAAYGGGLEVSGVQVASGVPDQPLGFDEIVGGARNRALAALKAAACDLAVGIEDGLVEIPGAPGGPLNVGCAALTDGTRVSIGLSSGFAYPPEASATAAARREPIGGLFDELWEARRGQLSGMPSAITLGNVGRLSLGVLTRSEYARHAVLCALLPFLHPDLYPVEGMNS